jgi:long-chain acyl-CoA synthetase
MGEHSQLVPDTLPKCLLFNHRKYGRAKIALREKDRGIWIPYTWSDYYSIVQRLAMAFLQLGLQKNDKVAIIGENKPQVYWFELAALTCGAPVLGIFSDCRPPEIEYFLNHSDATFVICQDQEQVDKILEIKERVHRLKKAIYWEKKGLWNYRSPLLITMDEMAEMGEKRVRQEPDLFEKLIMETRPDDVAVFFYTSGTTGLPKAALQSHYNILTMAEIIDGGDPVRETDEAVSFLPIAWIAEHLFNVTYSLLKGFTVNFPESQETVQENIREVGPHLILLSPRLWEEHIRTIRVKMADAGWLNRLCFGVALKVGYRVGDARMLGKKAGFLWRMLYFPAEKFVFRPLKDRLGLKRGRVARVGGTAVSPEVIRYFHAIGVHLVQAYGISECGIATMHSLNRIKPESSGPPLPGFEIRISDEGEILVKSPSLFLEYYKEPEKTARAKRDGWYYSGDFGRIDEDGHLIVMDRMEDLQRIAGDRRFSPQFAEVRMRFSPYIKDALVAGRRDRDYAVAIVNIDYGNVAHWAEANRIVYTTFVDLSQKEGVIELVRKEIQTVNSYLLEWARVTKFINLHKEFDPDEAELTRTRKIRRDFMERKYEGLLNALFGEENDVEVTASVTYQDGTAGEIRSLLSINQVGPK